VVWSTIQYPHEKSEVWLTIGACLIEEAIRHFGQDIQKLERKIRLIRPSVNDGKIHL
jgi:hypothetical protein